jgi:short-subunit dehydrogenase
MKELVLITGASSGIGYHLAIQLAARKFDLVLTARNQESLEKLSTMLVDKHQVAVYVFPADLSKKENAYKLFSDINARGLIVTKLINNAGVGLYGKFAELPLEDELAMIDLNVSSLVILTKLFSQQMVSRGSGTIMNVASLLSFLPFPYYSIYSATKAFVLAFSETIAAELEGTGVGITTLCPGPVDTGFNTPEMLRTNAYNANRPISPEQVATAGVKLLLKGKGKKIVGFNNWFISNLPRITPDRLMIKIKKHLASQPR